MKHFLSWHDITSLVDSLCTQIRLESEKQDKLPFELYNGVYGIPRGGLVVAVMISHKLNIPYITDLKTMYGKKFLVVDDIADTGQTLSKLKAEVYNLADIATLHYHTDSLVKPKYFVDIKNNDWIVYPWENENALEIQDYML